MPSLAVAVAVQIHHFGTFFCSDDAKPGRGGGGAVSTPPTSEKCLPSVSSCCCRCVFDVWWRHRTRNSTSAYIGKWLTVKWLTMSGSTKQMYRNWCGGGADGGNGGAEMHGWGIINFINPNKRRMSAIEFVAAWAGKKKNRRR